jgi:hypothetical protein
MRVPLNSRWLTVSRKFVQMGLRGLLHPPESKGDRTIFEGPNLPSSRGIKNRIRQARSMRSKWLRTGAAEVIQIAQEMALAGLGRRGADARDAMARARREALRRREEQRWRAIVRGAKRTAFEEVREDEASAATMGEDEAK